jgi:hypothetical protein
MLRFLWIFFALDVLGSGAAIGSLKSRRLPSRISDFLCTHKLITPVIVALVARFIALTSAAFWWALGAAIVLSWLYVIFAVTTAGPFLVEGNEGNVM